jgi:hypothetical protein
MIDVRSAKTEHRQKKDLSLDRSKDVFACQSISGHNGCGPSLVRED